MNIQIFLIKNHLIFQSNPIFLTKKKIFYYDENAYKKYSNSFLKHPKSKKETISQQIIRELHKL